MSRIDMMVSRAATFSPSGVDVSARTVKGVVTTQKVDSHRSIILTDGLDWERYLKNPVFCAQHDRSSLPIGQCVDLKPGKGQVTCTFLLNDSEEGEDYLQAYARGDLRGFSIGGQIREYVTRWDGEEAIKSLPKFVQSAFLDGSCYYAIKKMTVAEISAATVPSNDETLVFRSSRESNLECDIEILREQIDRMAKPKAKCDDDCDPCDDEEPEVEESKSDRVRRIAAITSSALPLFRYR